MAHAAIGVGSPIFVAVMALLLQRRAPWRLIMLLPAAIVLVGVAAVFAAQGWALWRALPIAAAFGGGSTRVCRSSGASSARSSRSAAGAGDVVTLVLIRQRRSMRKLMGEWAYAIAAMLILAAAVGLFRAGRVGSTPAAVALAIGTAIAFLGAWAVAGRATPRIMLPAILFLAAGTFIYWRFTLPGNLRRRRGMVEGERRLPPHGSTSMRGPTWKRWRLVMALSLVVSLVLAVAVIAPALGLTRCWAALLTLGLCAAALASDLAMWQRDQTFLLKHDWEW